MNLTQMIAGLARAKQTLQERATELEREITTGEQGLRALEMAPTARADVDAMLRAWVASAAADFEKTFAERLEIFVRDARKLEDPRLVASAVTLVGVSPDDAARALNGVLCAVHGDAVLKTMQRSLDRIEWPDQPVTSTEKAERRTRLERQLAEMRAERSAIYEKADEAGLRLS